MEQAKRNNRAAKAFKEDDAIFSELEKLEEPKFESMIAHNNNVYSAASFI
jgi:hypothetical protein